MAEIGTARAAQVVRLGGRDFAVLPQPIGRLARIRTHIGEVARTFADTAAPSTAAGVEEFSGKLIDALLAAPSQVLGLFVPDLPGPDDPMWTSETTGVTVPEIVEAFGVISRANRLDVLGGFFRAALPAMQTARR